jgi:hypothetical protein
MRYRELRKLAGSALDEGDDKSLAELKEQAKELESKEKICKLSNEKETAVISVIVLQL